MESAVFFAAIYDVKPFRSSVVALTFLRLTSSSAYRNCVATNHVVSTIQQQKFMVSFEHQDIRSSLL